ncbi:Hypothetical predicted protein, partial [Paramuricea clavata]
NHHLRGVKMDDEDTKAELPIHLILGAGKEFYLPHRPVIRKSAESTKFLPYRLLRMPYPKRLKYHAALPSLKSRLKQSIFTRLVTPVQK